MAQIQTSSKRSATSDYPWSVLMIWCVLRVLTSVWVVTLSPLSALTEQERKVALWPPSAPLPVWLERVVIRPWQRWDAVYYMNIAARGYRVDDGTAQFHPLFPWVARPLVGIGFSPLLALLVVSSVATIGLAWCFYRLARLDVERASAQTATLVLLCSPFSLALFVPYSEALFLLCAVVCLWCARQGRWWAAGLAGALASLTRQQGVFLLLPAAWELWDHCGRNWRRGLAAWRFWLRLGLIPGGYLMWVVYRAVALNDVMVDFSGLHTLVYSLLISPSAANVVPTQTFTWPWRALGLAFSHAGTRADADIVANLVGGAYFVLLAGIAWRYLRVSYRIYLVTIVLVSFAYHTGPVHPYMGLLRHLFLAFPVWIGVGRAARRTWARVSLVMSGFLSLMFFLLLYMLEAWVP